MDRLMSQLAGGHNWAYGCNDGTNGGIKRHGHGELNDPMWFQRRIQHFNGKSWKFEVHCFKHVDTTHAAGPWAILQSQGTVERGLHWEAGIVHTEPKNATNGPWQPWSKLRNKVPTSLADGWWPFTTSKDIKSSCAACSKWLRQQAAPKCSFCGSSCGLSFGRLECDAWPSQIGLPASTSVWLYGIDLAQLLDSSVVSLSMSSTKRWSGHLTFSASFLCKCINNHNLACGSSWISSSRLMSQ